jgi:hypothetical protein
VIIYGTCLYKGEAASTLQLNTATEELCLELAMHFWSQNGVVYQLRDKSVVLVLVPLAKCRDLGHHELQINYKWNKENCMHT